MTMDTGRKDILGRLHYVQPMFVIGLFLLAFEHDELVAGRHPTGTSKVRVYRAIEQRRWQTYIQASTH